MIKHEKIVAIFERCK